MSNSRAILNPVSGRVRSFGGRIVLLLILAIVLAEAVVTARYVKKRVLWDNFGAVVPGKIYRSGQLRPEHLREAIARYHLRTILSLSYEASGIDAEEEQIARENGVWYIPNRGSWDGNGVVREEELEWAYRIITDPARQPILIHCARGVSRTGALVAYVRMRDHGWSRQQIREEMIEFKHSPDDNPRLEAHLDQLFQVMLQR
jgi:protein tyrosine/serine phosphatase